MIYDGVLLATKEPCTPQKQKEFSLALKTLDQLSPDAIATSGDTVTFVKPVTFPVSILKGNSTEQGERPTAAPVPICAAVPCPLLAPQVELCWL